MKDFFHLVLQPNEEIFVVLNQSEKHSKIRNASYSSLLIQSSFDWKVNIFSKRVSKASNLIYFLLLML